MTGHPNYGGAVDVASLAIIGHVGAAQFVNTQHYLLPGTTTVSAGQAAVVTLCTDWDTNVRASFLGTKPPDFVLDVIRGTLIAVPGVAHTVWASNDQAPTTAVGTLGAAATGAYTDAVVLKIRTALGGKHFRGRNFVGPFPQGNQFLNGVLAATATLTALGTYRTALLRYLAGGADVTNHQMCVWSRPAHAGGRQWTRRVSGTLTVQSNPTAEAGTATPVTSLVWDYTGRTVRRREVGVGA